MGRAAGALGIALLCVGLARSQPPPVRIGVVIDGPWQRNTDVEMGSDRRRRAVPNHVGFGKSDEKTFFVFTANLTAFGF